jgi:hypothetical protein
MTITPGDIVIINETDEPSARMCAVVTAVSHSDGFCWGRYLTTYPRRQKCAGARATKVEDFGIRIVVSGGALKAVREHVEPTASYSDGAPRRWQDWEAERWWRCRKTALKHINKRYMEGCTVDR